jgi:hypothetical protein
VHPLAGQLRRFCLSLQLAGDEVEAHLA